MAQMTAATSRMMNQFEPAAYFHDARHHAVKYCGDEHERNEQRNERAFEVGVGELSVIEHQYDGRHAKKVEQVDAYAQSCHVHNQHKPAVAVRLVGVVFPFQYKPEHHRSERRRVGINLALNGTEPERVAERVDECAHKAARLDGNQLVGGKRAPVFQYQFACKVGDCPEQEQYTCGAKQCAHCVHHHRHLRRVAGEL